MGGKEDQESPSPAAGRQPGAGVAGGASPTSQGGQGCVPSTCKELKGVGPLRREKTLK